LRASKRIAPARRWGTLATLAAATALPLLLGAGVLIQPHAGRALQVAFVAVSWLALTLLGVRLHQQRRMAAEALQRLSRHLPSSHGADSGRDSRLMSTLIEDVTSEVEQMLVRSERRWKARAKLSADWYWETDASLQVTWVSEDLKSHVKLGLNPADLLGRRHDEVAFYQPPEGGWEALREKMAAQRPFRDIEIEVRRPGRSPVWTSISGRPRLDTDGAFLGYEGIGRDVTERRLAFKRLHDSERRYAVIADLSADWYWETDAEHRVTFVGPVLCALLGDDVHQLIGRQRWEAHPAGATEDAWARHREDLDARRPFQRFEFRILRPRRVPLWVSLSGLPRLDDKGEFAGFHGVGRDITLRKRAEKILLTRNAQLERLVAARTGELEQANRDLEAFARQLAHELRTPIGHVVGLADLLRVRAWDRLTDEEREWLQLQAQSARAMSLTVTALLELARSSSMPMVRERVDLSALAEGVVAELPWLERKAPVQWQVEPAMVADCSAALMRVVLMNLLGNAAKFTRDVEAPRVHFGHCEVEGQRCFFVEDNGAGFERERGGALFQPFVRLHANEQFQGTGLGLSIVRRVIERHGGQVRASGAPGMGARIEFSLAAAEGTAAANGDDAAASPSQAEGESPDDAQRSVA
jgi:PAS domain S-box-containing protein